jgi:hypothetical protein
MRGVRRDPPADFAEVAPTMGTKELARHYGTAWLTLKRWFAETGVKQREAVQRPMPEDFAELAATMTLRRLTKHFATNHRTVTRWAREAGITPRKGKRFTLIPLPEDFAVRAATMLHVDLCRHYGVHHRTVERWYAVAGLKPYRPARPEKPTRETTGYRRMTGAQKRAYAGPKSAFGNLLRRDDSLEGRAADFLRRFAAVYRCTEKGGVVEDKARLTHWRYGNVVLDADALVERAMRKGWAPNAWRALLAIGGEMRA